MDSPEGTTPLADAALTLRGHVRTEQHASSLFDNGTYVGGVLSTTHDITPSQAKQWQDEWIKSRQSGKVAVMGNGLEYRNELADGVSLQMVETRSYNASVVYAMLGIPQSIMGSSISARLKRSMSLALYPFCSLFTQLTMVWVLAPAWRIESR